MCAQPPAYNHRYPLQAGRQTPRHKIQPCASGSSTSTSFPARGRRAPRHALYREALEQVELADRLGFDYVWEVEHHFLEEYSHSSAPEVFLAAASQRTTRIRLGHGIVNVMPSVNHPARIAERLATLDLVSGGRVDFGTGESSSAAELGGFLIDREHKREMWHEALDATTRMLAEEPFAGIEGQFVQMPPRNVVPKPLQRPHPPIWVACSRRETIHLAGRNGIGALSFSFVEPEDAAKWVQEYYELIAGEECVPAGFAVNPNIAVVLPMMLAQDEGRRDRARDRRRPLLRILARSLLWPLPALSREH